MLKQVEAKAVSWYSSNVESEHCQALHYYLPTPNRLLMLIVPRFECTLSCRGRVSSLGMCSLRKRQGGGGGDSGGDSGGGGGGGGGGSSIGGGGSGDDSSVGAVATFLDKNKKKQPALANTHPFIYVCCLPVPYLKGRLWYFARVPWDMLQLWFWLKER